MRKIFIVLGHSIVVTKTSRMHRLKTQDFSNYLKSYWISDVLQKIHCLFTQRETGISLEVHVVMNWLLATGS